ncbi:MAG: hypothetical protein D6731_20885 [Planctomycetota bacterium]|nr:MAG: hypothetical protein D6731_20885 [Planctomycetota bacterium]
MKRESRGWAPLLLCVLGVSLARGQQASPKGYVEMPPADDGAWVLTHPPGSNRNWGRPVFVRYLALVAREWRRRYPDRPRLRLGDLSKADGSPFPPHKTHRDGLTADLFTTPQNICHVRWTQQEWTLDLARLLADYGAKQILYNGDLVVRSVPVAKKWKGHDDHFHVVIDPARVPAEGAPLVFAEGPLADGGWISRGAVDEERRGLLLRWRVLGGAKLKGVRVRVEEGAGTPLHDSGWTKLRRPEYRLPEPLRDGLRYRWRVDVETAAGHRASTGWQTVRTDFTPPSVSARSPRDGAEVSGPPTLRWTFRKRGVAQARYRIELDGDPNHRKVKHRLGPFEGEATQHRLEEVRLKRTKRYYWRVVATDAHGNEGASEWVLFRTGRSYGKPRPAQEGGGEGRGAREVRVRASRLNLRAGPGTQHPVRRTLTQGTRLRVLAERGDWLEVELCEPAGGEPARGFVSRRYVE